MEPERDDGGDRDLLARLAAGERAALGELYDRHARSLYRHAYALAGCGHEADDLVQAVFVKLAGTGAPLLGIRKPASYLHRMLRTAWIDEQRGRATRSEHPLDAVTEPAARGSADDSRIDAERALARLPEEQREVVVLHVVIGLSLRETGQVMGVGTFTAASRYRLGLARMRKFLEGRR